MSQKPTRAWYLISFLLPILGGIIAYFAVKDQDQSMANKLLLVTFLPFLIIPLILVPAGILASWATTFANQQRSTTAPTPTGNTDTSTAPSSSECTPDWQCSGWSECSTQGTQTRTCSDINECGTSAAKPTESRSCTYIARMGDNITVDNLKYSVIGALAMKYVGSGYLTEEADGTFVILTLRIENTGKESEYISSSAMKLRDAQDRTYEPDTGAGIYLESMGVGFQSLSFDKLGPGLEKEGSVVFDVPEDDTGLRLGISEGGLFSTEQRSVLIGDVSSL